MELDFKNKNVMIVGAGRSVLDYRDSILKYIDNNNVITIGINLMTSLCVPDYHLWTNKKRYIAQNRCISSKSKLLFGSGMSSGLIRRFYKGDYEVVKYINKSSFDISYDGKVIRGNFRTAGILAVMVAHLGGCKRIDIVGMDGFTFYDKKDLKNNKKNQHCWGEGYSDDADWEKCLKKDDLVYNGLNSLKTYGANFRVLTPTKFDDFYDSTEVVDICQK